MRTLTVADLERDPELKKLILQARDAAYRRAYAPYSGFAVGATARDKNGNIYRGANLENAAYGVVMCAEVGALTAANVAGAYDQLDAIAVVGFGFHPHEDCSQIVTPCGRCRQLIYEASELSKDKFVPSKHIDVFACSGDLKQIEQWSIAEMLPRAFGPKTLGISNPPNPAKAGMKPFDNKDLTSAGAGQPVPS
jgi:cytidine deaminase